MWAEDVTQQRSCQQTSAHCQANKAAERCSPQHRGFQVPAVRTWLWADAYLAVQPDHQRTF